MNGVDSWNLNEILVYITLYPFFGGQFAMENWSCILSSDALLVLSHSCHSYFIFFLELAEV